VSERACWDCGGNRYDFTTTPGGLLCMACRRRRHYHPATCPQCGDLRPLAFHHDDRIVCASCAGVASVFACRDCGREDQPYGLQHCARCILRERLTSLLTDPATGAVHHRLQPVFDELVNSERPQTGIWWLRKKPGIGPALLGQMARGETPISHDTFRALPATRTREYVRMLLTATGVLPPVDYPIERVLAWLDGLLDPLPDPHADLVRRYAHWHVLRGMRRAASRGHLTRSTTTAARNQIRAAVRFLTWLDTHNVTVADATQHHLEDYQQSPASDRSADGSFIRWLRDSRINTRLRVATLPATQPAVTISDEQRWEHVHRLLHDPSLRSYTRLGGLFTLLFAQPLHRIAAMRTDQVTTTDTTVHVTFHTTPIQMPPLLDDLVHDHLKRRGQSLYVSRDTGWLFPGGHPGQHLTTEAFRRDLVKIGIKPYEARKAALFQLAGSAPAPILAELLGLTDSNAADWARLAARDWTHYIALRAQ